MKRPNLLSLLGGQYESYLKIIGEMSLTFASIEQAVIQLVCICMGDDDWEKALVILDDMPYRKTVDLLEQLAPKTRNASLQAQVVDLLPFLRKAGKDRNQYIHATMMMGLSQHGEYIMDTVRFRKGRKNTARTVKLSELRQVLEVMIATQNIAERLVIDLMK